MRIGDRESEAFWLDTFRCLKKCGLKEVHCVVSDDHSGLVNAAQCCFQGEGNVARMIFCAISFPMPVRNTKRIWAKGSNTATIGLDQSVLYGSLSVGIKDFTINMLLTRVLNFFLAYRLI